MDYITLSIAIVLKKTVGLLGYHLYDLIHRPRDMLLSSDKKSQIDVMQNYGLSKIELSILNVRLVTGSTVLNGLDDASNILTLPGSINAGDAIRWLVLDQLMVAIIGTLKNEQLVFTDLNKKEIYGTCIGMYITLF